MFKVLIVEDEPDLAEIYGMEFKSFGAEVFEADNVEIAFKIAKEKQPDIIFLDLLLGKNQLSEGNDSRTGLILLNKLKMDVKTKNIKVAICSNIDTQGDRNKCKQLGACCYVVKSDIVPSELLDLAKKLIKQP